NTYQNSQNVTLVFGAFDNTYDPVLSGKSNSLIYKITGITGNTLYLDRNTPILTGLTGSAEVVGNNCNIEFPLSDEVISGCIPTPISPEDQHDPWTLEIVFGENPIGYTGLTNYNLTGITGNQFISTKQYLGYTT